MEPQENSAPIKPVRWAGLGKRVVSAIALGVISVICLVQGGLLFSVFILLAALVMKKEWDSLTSGQSLFVRAGGYGYVILPCASLLWLRGIPDAGLSATVTLIAIITATDIGAYFVGKRFGRHKLSPIISPNKTWEGLAGGVIAAIVVALPCYAAIPFPTLQSHKSAIGLGLFVALLAQAGDLFESSLKRRADVKDSGTLLPGHGGLLDRFDGYMFAAPVFALFIHTTL